MSDTKWGSSRWAEEEEIKKDLCLVDLKNVNNEGGGVLLLRDKNGNLYTDSGERNTMIFGITGSGKTRSVLLPSIISTATSHLVMFDPKGELLRHSKSVLEKKGVKTLILNLKDFSKESARYNPLYIPGCLYRNGNHDQATRMFYSIAETIFPEENKGKDPFWNNASISYFVGLCITACEIIEKPEELDLDRIYSLHVAGNKEMGECFFKRYFKGNEESMAGRLTSTYIDSPNETRKSILSVFSEGLTKYISNRALIDIISGKSSITPRGIVESEKPIALYICVSDSGAYVEKAVAQMLIEQLYQELVRIADLEYGGKLPRKMDFMLDEFSTLKIHDMNNKISVSRSRNIRFTMCAQSLQQLSHVYGKEMASILLGNAANLLYLSSSDIELQKYLSERAGVRISNFTNEKRPLLSVADLQHIKKGNMVVFHGANYPYLSTNLVDISKYRVVEDKELFDISMLPARKEYQKNNIDMEALLRKKIKQRIMSDIEKSAKSQVSETHRKERKVRRKPLWALKLVPEEGLYFYKDYNAHVSDIKDREEMNFEVIYTEEMNSESQVLVLFFAEREDDEDGTHNVHAAIFDIDGPKVRRMQLKSLDENRTDKEMKALLEHIVDDILLQMNLLF